jgi:MFS family permease
VGDQKTVRLWTREFFTVSLSSLLLTSAFYALLPTLPIYLTRNLGFTPGVAGVLVASISITTIIIRPFAGYLMDNFHRFVVLLGSLLALTLVFGSYLVVTTMGAMLAIRLVHGLAFGIFTSSAATVAADIIPVSRRGEGIGIFGLTSSLGMMVGPLIGLKALTLQGPTAMFLWVLAISFFAFVCAGCGPVRYEKPVKKKLALGSLIHTKAIPVSLAMFFIMVVYGFIIVFIAIYALARGFSNVAFFFICFSLCVVVSRFFLGRVFDKGHVLFLVVCGLALVFSGTAWLGLVRNQTEFIVAGMVAGLGFGTLMPTGQTQVNNLVEPAERGAANSTYFFSYDLGIGAGALFAGFLSGKTSLGLLYLYSSSLVLVAAAIFLFVAIPHYDLNKTGK